MSSSKSTDDTNDIDHTLMNDTAGSPVVDKLSELTATTTTGSMVSITSTITSPTTTTNTSVKANDKNGNK